MSAVDKNVFLPDWRTLYLGVMVFALVGAIQSAAFSQGAEPVEHGDDLDQLLILLTEKTVPAFVHTSLFDKYGLEPDTEVNSRKDYSRGQHNVRLTEFEEWPASMIDSLECLEDSKYEELRRALKIVRARKQPNVLRRVIAQSELWTAFDSLYLTGILPRHEGRFDRLRWRVLLWEISQTISCLAPTSDELRSIPSFDSVVAEVFGKPSYDDAAEIWNIQTPLLHDVGNGYRRSIRIRLHDPGINLQKLTPEQVEGFTDRTIRFNVGAVASVEEYALGIDSKFAIVSTPVLLILKVYRVTEGTGNDRPLDFGIYKINRSATESRARNSLIRFPDDSEGWAKIDFPNFPDGHKVARRTPLIPDVCAGCHSSIPKVFRPGYRVPPADTIRLASGASSFAEERNILTKRRSPEAIALWSYFSSKSPEE